MIVDSIQFLTADYAGDLVDHMTLSLRGTDLSQSYILKTATGLDPNDILTQYYASVTIDEERYLPNERFYDMKPASRIVSFKIGMNPQWGDGETLESLRNNLYKMISYSHNGIVLIDFMNGDETQAYLLGFVTHIESDMFSKDATITITFNCIDPFLRATGVLSSIDPSSSAAAENFTITTDTSTAPHGFNAEFIFTIDQSSFIFDSILDVANPARFEVIYEFKSNDKLFVRTDRADRQVYLKTYSDGYVDTYYLMDKVTIGSVWPTMYPDGSDRAMGVGADSGVLIHELAWLPTYWGI